MGLQNTFMLSVILSPFDKLPAGEIADDTSSISSQFGTLSCRHGRTTYAPSHACILTDSHERWKPRRCAGFIETTLLTLKLLTYNSDTTLGHSRVPQLARHLRMGPSFGQRGGSRPAGNSGRKMQRIGQGSLSARPGL